MTKYGYSFSVPYAQYLGIDPKQALKLAITDMQAKRFRLMSYWNRLEPVQGQYDWRELDWQIKMAEEYNAEVTLCLGLKQPRWPESHWPDWVNQTNQASWEPLLHDFVSNVIKRYSKSTAVISFQLENEALLKNFGTKGNYDRSRLKRELTTVKQLTDKPVIMSTSDSWGIPIFGPRPDIYGFSIYRYFYRKNKFRKAIKPAFLYSSRAKLINLLQRRPVFIHELQAEPWGDKGLVDMTLNEQLYFMGPDKVQQAIDYARTTRLQPVDIWGLEWWIYLRQNYQYDQIYNIFRQLNSSD